MARSGVLLITGSVGLGGLNQRRDVLVVQHLLNRAGNARLKEDGIVGNATVGAIRRYQSTVLGYPRPDARVDPQGRMLRSLAARVAPRPRAAAAEPGWLEGLGRMAGSAWSGLESLLQGWRTEDRAQTQRTAQASRPAARRSGGGAGGVISDAEYERVARRLGPKVDPLLVRALAEKESGGKSGFAADGRIIIAFEGHKFRKYTGRIYDRSHPKLSYPWTKAGWKAKWRVNNADQATAWRTLEAAMALDHDAALKSTSFGAFQILGENHADCGYPDVDEFVDLMKSGAAGQLEAFVLFCKMKPGLVAAMERQDFDAIGTKYNGGGVASYGSGLRAIYNRLKGE